MAERLMEAGMSLKDAVNNVSYSYGFTEDAIYKYMTDNDIAQQGH